LLHQSTEGAFNVCLSVAKTGDAALALATSLTLALSRTLAPALPLSLLLSFAFALTFASTLPLALAVFTTLSVKCIVQQLLLSLNEIAETFKRLHHAFGLGVACECAHLQALKHIAQLAQHPLRKIAGSGFSEILDLLEHLLQILCG